MKNLLKINLMMMICFFIAHSAFAEVTADFTADQTEIVAGTSIQSPILISATPGIEEITLEWNAIPENKTGHFDFEELAIPCPVWTIYIGGANFDGIEMEAGDEIGIFDGDLLVGAITLDHVCTPDNQFDNELIAYPYLINGPGYQAGNTFTFIAWDESAQIESTTFEYTFSDPYGDAWTGDVFPDYEGHYSLAEFAFTYEPTTFNIYYENGTLVAGEVEGTTYTDLDLTAGQEYCYYVTQILESGEESNPSNVLCATPLSNNAPVLISAIPGIEEITLEWELIPENKTNHFGFVWGGYMYPKWTIYVGEATFDGIDMESGDEIGVFDGDLLVGAITLFQVCTPENQFDNYLIAFTVIFSGTGYVPGNPFTLVAWDESAQIESTSFEYTFSDPYGDAWTGDVFPYGENEYSMAEFSFSSNYVPTFNIYYEDSTLVAGEVEGTTYTDTDLTPGQEYCYYVKQILPGGDESDKSNVVCEIAGLPIISTDPEYFYIGIGQNPIITDYLHIFNDGSINLNWSAVVEYYTASDWITITPDSGTINPNDLQEVELVFDATNFNPEEQYLADILIISNDPYTPILAIPIEMIISGIEEQETFSLIVSPNPSTGLFNISLKEVIGDIQIKVLDIRGKVFSNFELNGVTSTKLDLKDLSAGVYFINFSGKDFNFVKKIIIK
ncbi:MAG: T9SS type A sorting domain-containing protein [Bacteroidales bacterium]|nr:T9SS type A sorting domain-containing protein [Bacteroidales bacterium]